VYGVCPFTFHTFCEATEDDSGYATWIETTSWYRALEKIVVAQLAKIFIPYLHETPKVRYNVHKIPSLGFILSQMNPVQTPLPVSVMLIYKLSSHLHLCLASVLRRKENNWKTWAQMGG
jgi:hypothetical protein